MIVLRLKNIAIAVILAFLFSLVLLVSLLIQLEESFILEDVSRTWLPVRVRSFHKDSALTDNAGRSNANKAIPNVDEFVKKFQSLYGQNPLLKLDPQESYETFLIRWYSHKKIGLSLTREVNTTPQNSMERYHRGVNQFYMYDPCDLMLPELLKDLSTLPLVSTKVPTEGTQLKFHLTFADGSQARFKPMRAISENETDIDTYFMLFFENHLAEIAGFHLDRVLGFHRAVPTVGRNLNITEILQTLVDAKSSVQHVYTSYRGDLCFIVQCDMYCGPDYPYCGFRDILPGAVSVAMPPRGLYASDFKLHPYMRSYSRLTQANWETNDTYCNSFVKKNLTLHKLLEFMDLAAFDFLTGNLDRHSYDIFDNLGDDSFVPVYDNGRGFSQSSYDHMSALIPLKQCCLIRLSTLAKLIKLYHGPDSISKVMRSSLNSDPLSPVLTEPHLDALDRRLPKILKTISDCLANASSWHDVIIDELNIL